MDLPQHGKLIGEGSNQVYVPEKDFNGLDSFTYIVFDGELNSETLYQQFLDTIHIVSTHVFLAQRDKI